MLSHEEIQKKLEKISETRPIAIVDCTNLLPPRSKDPVNNLSRMTIMVFAQQTAVILNKKWEKKR